MLDFLVGNDPLTGIIAFFVVLIPLILVHELGHFLAAKAVGISVLEFGIGFPPRIVKLFTWRETEFTLNWLPLGGFVRPLGDDLVRPLDEESVAKDRDEVSGRGSNKPKSVNEARPLGRILFMGAGAAANFLLAIVLFVLIALMGLPQVVGSSVEVIAVQPDSMLGQAGIRAGDFILDLNGREYATADEYVSALYSLGGEIATLVVQRSDDPTPVTITFTPDLANVRAAPSAFAQIAGVVEDAPADRAGILPGDIVMALNGEPIDGVAGLGRSVRDNAGREVVLTLQRGAEEIEVTLTPRQNPPEGQGPLGIAIWPAFDDAALGLIYRDGFPQEVVTSASLEQAMRYGFERTGFVISTIVRLPSDLASGVLTPEEARPVSIVGISQIGAVAIQQSIEQNRPQVILNFIAMISVALGFFNLLPIPALDGGRIVFVLVEMVRGKPISPEREGLVHLVGLALLLSLSIIIILNDVINPITSQIR